MDLRDDLQPHTTPHVIFRCHCLCLYLCRYPTGPCSSTSAPAPAPLCLKYSVCLSVCLSVSLSLRLSLFLCVGLFVSVYVCLSLISLHPTGSQVPQLLMQQECRVPIPEGPAQNRNEVHPDVRRGIAPSKLQEAVRLLPREQEQNREKMQAQMHKRSRRALQLL